MSKVRLTLDAEQDLIGIWQYISARNPAAAIRVVGRIEAQLDLLGENPSMGEAWDRRIPGLRCYSLDAGYVTFFKPFSDGIEVARILHGARDADAIIDE